MGALSCALSRVSPATRSGAVLGDVALEVEFSSLGNEALTTLLAAAFDAITAGLGGHACTETMLLFARALSGLVGTEAHDKWLVKFCVPVGARGRDFR